MRSYPRNSPEAAARVVALVLIADGHVGRSEELALEHLDIRRELGLTLPEFARIVQTLCEDRSVAHPPSTPMTGHIDRATLGTLLAEVDDPALRRKIIRLCLAVAAADNYLADGEIATLAAILTAWTSLPGAVIDARDVATLRAQPRAAATTRDASA
jgi:hypothetical protein